MQNSSTSLGPNFPHSRLDSNRLEPQSQSRDQGLVADPACDSTRCPKLFSDLDARVCASDPPRASVHRIARQRWCGWRVQVPLNDHEIRPHVESLEEILSGPVVDHA
eukprot:3143667-Rhodomonas_salina.1